MCVGAVLAGLLVTVTKPLPVTATPPTPGIVTTSAGGSIIGYGTSIAQYPQGLALSGSTLLIADYIYSVVRALDTATDVETIYAGNFQAASSGDGGQATSASLNHPMGLALDAAGNLFIATADSIRKVTAGGVISTVASGLTTPNAVTVDASDNLFVADTTNNKILKITSGGAVSTFAGTGADGFAGDTGPASAAKLSHPQGVLVDGAGDVYISDTGNSRVRKVDHSTGDIDTVAGGGTGGPVCANGNATSVALFLPEGLSMDSHGDLLIADTQNNCVRSLSGTTLTTLVQGAGNPFQAIADASDNLYISSPSGPHPDVVEVDAGTTTQKPIAGDVKCRVYGLGGQASAAMLCQPYVLQFDSQGNLYVADTLADQVLKIDQSGVLTVVAGTGNIGYSADGTPATSADLSGPVGLAFNSAGDLFISDDGNRVIRRVDHVSGKIYTVAGTPGAYGFSGDGGPATSAVFFEPEGIAFDAADNLFISDLGNYRVRKVTPAGIISTYAGCGQQGSSCAPVGSGGPATGSFINGPFQLAVDSGGNLFIAQTGPLLKVDANANMTQLGPYSSELGVAIGPSDRVVATESCEAVLLATTGSTTVLAGSPTCGLGGDGGPARSAAFDFLGGVAFDASGDMFLADYYNHRIRRVQAYTAPAAPTAVTAVGGRNSANVQWSAPADDGGLPILQYAVTPYNASTPGSPTWVGGATSSPVHRLIDGVAYTFTVSAFNGWAQGPESAHSLPVTPTITPHGLIDTMAGSPGSGTATALGQDPYAVAWGATGAGGDHVFVGDIANPVLRDLNAQSGQETVFAGNDGYGFSGDGGSAIKAMINGAGAIADCGGTVYFADTYNYVIRKVDSSGKITTVAGTGEPGYSGDGGPATRAEIGRVFGLACWTDAGQSGLYISDSDNGAIRLLDGSGTISTWFYGFSFPTGIVEAPNQTVPDLYVADSGYDNALFELVGSSAYWIAGTPGKAGYSGDNGPSTSALLNDPEGLALWGNWLFVADRGNNRIRVVDNRYWTISSFADGSSLSGPSGLAADFYSSNVYIADTGHNRVAVMSVAGGAVTTVAGNGTLSWSGDGGAATAAQMGNPYGVTFDPSGNEYIADNQDNVIRKVDLDGNITTVAGNGIAGFAGDGGPATLAELNGPRGLASDKAGNIYISDTGNQRIRELRTDGTITTIAGNGTAGFSGDGGSAKNARINYPRGVAVDGAGNVYIADTANNRVRKVVGGNISTIAGNGSTAVLNLPRGLAFDSAGDLFITDSGNNRVRELVGSTLTTVAGNGIAGLKGDGGPATSAELNDPFGVGVDAAGNLYIADTLNNRIRMVDSHGDISSVVGICGTRSGFAGDGGLAVAAFINAPFGIYVDAVGEVYIADVDNNRVRAGYGLTSVSRAPTCQAPAATPPPRTALPARSPLVADAGGHPRFSTVAIPQAIHRQAISPGAHLIKVKATSALHATSAGALPPAGAASSRAPGGVSTSAPPLSRSGQSLQQPTTAAAIYLGLAATLLLVVLVALGRRRLRRRARDAGR